MGNLMSLTIPPNCLMCGNRMYGSGIPWACDCGYNSYYQFCFVEQIEKNEKSWKEYLNYESFLYKKAKEELGWK